MGADEDSEGQGAGAGRRPLDAVQGEAPVDLLRWGAVALLVGLGLRILEASVTSLWLDELHTLHHASQASLGAVLESVQRDFHVPLFFLVVHLLGDWSDGAWLRWLPIVTSVVTALPVVGLARSARAGPASVALALWLYATLPYQVHYGAELRPYAFLALFSAGAAWSAFTVSGPSWLRFVLFLACVGLGLVSHRLMAVCVLAIGFTRLLIRRPGMLGLGWLILSGTLAVLPALPWFLEFAQTMAGERLEQQEATGGFRVRTALLKEVRDLPLRLFVPYMGSLGQPWASVARGGAVLLFGGVLASAVAWIRARLAGRIEPASPTRRACALYAVSAYVLLSAATLFFWDRAPLQYYTLLAWTVPVCVAALPFAARGRARTALVAAIAAGSLVTGVATAAGASREDMRGAVRTARELAAAQAPDRPLFTALLAQPGDIFANRLPYSAYGQDLEFVEPADVPRPGEVGFDRPLLVIRRLLTLEHPKWQPILDGREMVEKQYLDRTMTVYLFRPAAP